MKIMKNKQGGSIREEIEDKRKNLVSINFTFIDFGEKEDQFAFRNEETWKHVHKMMLEIKTLFAKVRSKSDKNEFMFNVWFSSQHGNEVLTSIELIMGYELWTDKPEILKAFEEGIENSAFGWIWKEEGICFQFQIIPNPYPISERIETS